MRTSSRKQADMTTFPDSTKNTLALTLVARWPPARFER
jgi:hypothetical protein